MDPCQPSDSGGGEPHSRGGEVPAAVGPLPPGAYGATNDTATKQLATLEVQVPASGAEMADPEATLRRAANVLARLRTPWSSEGYAGPRDPGRIRTTGRDQRSAAHMANHGRARRPRNLDTIPSARPLDTHPGNASAGKRRPACWRDSHAIGRLEQNGQFGPFAVVLGQELFLVAQTPDMQSPILLQDRIIPFLGGGPLLRYSTLDDWKDSAAWS